MNIKMNIKEMQELSENIERETKEELFEALKKELFGEGVQWTDTIELRELYKIIKGIFK